MNWPDDYLIPGIEPYHVEEAGIIYCGDCRDILPLFPKVNLVLTDPPYDVHAGRGGGCFGNRNHLVNTGGFTDGGCDYGFLANMNNWFCFCSKKQLRALIEKAENCDNFNILTWCKPNPVPTCNNKYLPDLEFIVHGFEKGRLFGNMKIKSSYSIIPCGQKETSHPNEKPKRLINKLVNLGTIKQEIILDPFLGSGTTAVAAKELGRKFIGIEISEEYCAIAVKRLRQGVLNFG
jgi:DNA modification methylase